MLKHMDFYDFLEKIKKRLLDTGLDCIKTASKKVVHKTGESLGNKMSEVVTKSKENKILKQETVEEIIIQRQKREEILNELRQVLYKWNTIKYLSY